MVRDIVVQRTTSYDVHTLNMVNMKSQVELLWWPSLYTMKMARILQNGMHCGLDGVDLNALCFVLFVAGNIFNGPSRRHLTFWFCDATAVATATAKAAAGFFFLFSSPFPPFSCYLFPFFLLFSDKFNKACAMVHISHFNHKYNLIKSSDGMAYFLPFFLKWIRRYDKATSRIAVEIAAQEYLKK